MSHLLHRLESVTSNLRNNETVAPDLKELARSSFVQFSNAQLILSGCFWARYQTISQLNLKDMIILSRKWILWTDFE